MNPAKHSQYSARRLGGDAADYLAIHSFIDHTKSLCPDMRHRILHTNWAINEIIIPIFGATLINSAGTAVDVKDLCEKDHILPDYRNRFIPTIADFADAIKLDDSVALKNRISRFHKQHAIQPAISKLMLSPLAHTGSIKSLLFTHNSWFINHIVPQIFDTEPTIENFDLTPSLAFSAMQFYSWMDNGKGFPPSAVHFSNQTIRSTST